MGCWVWNKMLNNDKDYAHPAHLSQRIITAMADCDKVVNYLDMPIQHAADSILKSMRRGLG